MSVGSECADYPIYRNMRDFTLLIVLVKKLAATYSPYDILHLMRVKFFVCLVHNYYIEIVLQSISQDCCQTDCANIMPANLFSST